MIDANFILAVASVLLFGGLIAFFAFLIRHQDQIDPKEEDLYGVPLLRQHYEAGETVEQPTPYYVSPIPASPDPLEIASNLDKKIVVGAATIFLVFASLGGYFLIQGNLRADAVEHQLSLDVRRGKEIYVSLCYDCHGRDGRGGTTPAGETLPGFPLNKPDFKFETLAEDPARLGEVRDLIEETIARGRDNPPGQYDMPAWAREEGGQLSQWQVKQLADLIIYGSQADWEDIAHIRREHDPDGEVAEQIPERPALPSGEELARATCGACHSFVAQTVSPNPLAPNLSTYGVEGPLITELRALMASGDPLWLEKWIANPPAIKPGTAMPPQGAASGGTLDEEAIALIAEYLKTLGTEEPN